MIRNKRNATNLHQLVSDAIDHLPTQPHNQEWVFGTFLQMRLDKRQWSQQEFAHKLGLPLALIELVLAGEIPGWFMSDAAIKQIATVLEEEPVIVSGLLGRSSPVLPLSADEVAELLADE